MTFVQQLLVAPAALGLMAPLPVVNSPSVNAAKLNINGVTDYAASADQVTSGSPVVFYLSRPMGGLTPADSTFQQLGGLIKPTFVF